jgi:SAM-dependent methyltransferase
MVNYDVEAGSYDRTRGGDARAASAAGAVARLLPEAAGTLADLACGTGIVTARLPGRRVLGLDLSRGMAGVAAGRLPGRVAVGDVTRLPLGGGRVDAVVMIWLLHLLGDAASAAALAEAARTLRPGGTLITTVDKDDARFAVHSDIADLVLPVSGRYPVSQSDAFDRVTGLAAALGLEPTGQTTFAGTGQGRSPREWTDALLGRDLPWVRIADADVLAGLRDRLKALPGQDRPRPDPVYRLVRFTKAGPGL